MNIEGKRTVKHYTVLTNHLSNGSIEFRTPGDVFYNTPIYLLKTNDGRTRVIRVFCNKDNTGDSKLTNDHYEYDDSTFCYDLYNTEFENVWSLSNVINIA